MTHHSVSLVHQDILIHIWQFFPHHKISTIFCGGGLLPCMPGSLLFLHKCSIWEESLFSVLWEKVLCRLKKVFGTGLLELEGHLPVSLCPWNHAVSQVKIALCSLQ